MQRFQEAQKFVVEADAHGFKSPELLRVHVSALSELKKYDELLSLSHQRLPEFNSEALVILGELAAKKGNIDLLNNIASAVNSLNPADTEIFEIFKTFRWEALSRAGEIEAAVQEILREDIAQNGSIITTCVAGQVLKSAGRAIEADAVIRRAKFLVTVDSSEPDQLFLADLLYNAQQWSDAAKWYERLTPSGKKISGLHNKLLTCYVRTQNRSKAKAFLSSLSPDWIANDDTRRLAIELGQQAGDWTFLQPLANEQITAEPHLAKSWLFKLSIALKASTPAQFLNELRSVPELLEGSITSLAQLASLEIRYGEKDRGMRRLYHFARMNFDDPKALSSYFLSIITGPTELPFMDEHLTRIVAGSAVTLQDETGQILQVIIDPEHVNNAPIRENFFSPISPTAKALIASDLDEEIELPTLSFGGSRYVKVVAIQSAYRRMLHLAQERSSSLNGLPDIKSVPIGSTGDFNKDYEYMLRELKRSNETSKEFFEYYRQGGLTLNGFAHYQGRSPIDVAIGWPNQGTPIYTSTGTFEEQQVALGLLNRSEATYLIDALTIAELVKFNIQNLLELLPKVLITPSTHEILKAKLEEVTERRIVGTATEFDGRIQFIEFSQTHRQKQIDFANAMLDAVSRYCIVEPVYGELTLDEEFHKITDILQKEELDLVLLCQENNATLLTLDGRLRALLKQVAGIYGIWPQMLLMHGIQTGIISAGEGARATAQMFLSNRTLVMLNDGDLLWMLLQGGHYAQLGMQGFKRILASSDTDFESAVMVSLGFLKKLAPLQVQLGAFGELLSHFVEAALRNKQCTERFLKQIQQLIYEVTEQASSLQFGYPPVNAIREQRIDMQCRFLLKKVLDAHELSKQPPVDRPILIRVLYCTKLPQVMMAIEPSIGH